MVSAGLLAVSSIDGLDLTRGLPFDSTAKGPLGRELDSGVRCLVTQAPANNNAEHNSSDGETDAARSSIDICRANTAGEQRCRLNETKPKHLPLLRLRKTITKIVIVTRKDRAM